MHCFSIHIKTNIGNENMKVILIVTIIGICLMSFMPSLIMYEAAVEWRHLKKNPYKFIKTVISIGIILGSISLLTYLYLISCDIPAGIIFHGAAVSYMVVLIIIYKKNILINIAKRRRTML